jgi:hypothetical protein
MGLADARLLDRNVQSRKLMHAALRLLMLEVVTTGPHSTISLKRSTQNLQLPQAGRPISLNGGAKADIPESSVTARTGREQVQQQACVAPRLTQSPCRPRKRIPVG